MTNNRQRGKRVERAAAEALSQATGLSIKRTAQASGKLIGDLMGLPGIHLEVKGRVRFGVTPFMAQAMRDCPEGQVPVVVLVPMGKPNDAMILMRVDLVEDFSRRLLTAIDSYTEPPF